jgi:hypothetical protein
MATLAELAEINTVDRDAADERRRAKKAADRERQQRKRERDAARRLADAEAEARRIEAEAEQAERIAESLAPSVTRQAIYAAIPRSPAYTVVTDTHGTVWVEGDVTGPPRMIRGPLIQIDAGRAHHGAALPQFSGRQNRAARSLRNDWRDVGEGCKVPAVDYGRVGGGSGSDDGWPGGHKAMLAQTAARVRLQAALTFLGAFTPGIWRVVLDRVPIEAWAEESGQADPVNWIRAGLERLANFYAPPHDTAQKAGFLTFGPSRESYDTSVDGMDGENNG